jgi:hypothetical protein
MKTIQAKFQTRGVGTVAAAIVTLVFCGTAAAQDTCPLDADDFVPDPTATSVFLPKFCTWRTTGNNPFFKLQPGYRIVLEDDEEKVVITVLHRTKIVDGIRTRVVLEDEFERDGDEWERVEKSFNYFVLCEETRTVFYMGEDVELYEDGELVGSEGAWLAGRNGAKPGIIMPGTPLIGAKYYEEIAPEDEALDKGEIVAVDASCTVGDRHFRRPCVSTVGSNDCNDDNDEKVYVAGIGIVYDDGLELVRYGFIDDD